jgi:quinol monooxygenase YgiN
MGFIVTVRGTLKSADEQAARKAHDSAAGQVRTLGKTLGNLHHQPYLNPENPREFFDVDVWNDDQAGLKKFFSDPGMAKAMGELFEGMPEIKVFEDKGWLSW